MHSLIHSVIPLFRLLQLFLSYHAFLLFPHDTSSILFFHPLSPSILLLLHPYPSSLILHFFRSFFPLSISILPSFPSCHPSLPSIILYISSSHLFHILTCFHIIQHCVLLYFFPLILPSLYPMYHSFHLSLYPPILTSFNPYICNLTLVIPFFHPFNPTDLHLCYPSILPFFHPTTILSSYHSFISSSDHPYGLSAFSHPIRSFYYLAILPSCCSSSFHLFYPTIILFCYHTILPSFYLNILLPLNIHSTIHLKYCR